MSTTPTTPSAAVAYDRLVWLFRRTSVGGLAGFVLVGVCLALYSLVGETGTLLGVVTFPYPFLSTFGDPVLTVAVALLGGFVVLECLSLVLFEFLTGMRDLGSVVVVVAGAVGVRLGVALLLSSVGPLTADVGALVGSIGH